MVGVPHLQRIHQPGHRSLLVSWTRAGHEQIPLPAVTEVLAGVADAHHGTIAVVDPSVQPRRWQMIGKTALSLVHSLPGLDDQAIINSIPSQEPVDQAAYHEIGSRDRVVGFLRLPAPIQPIFRYLMGCRRKWTFTDTGLEVWADQRCHATHRITGSAHFVPNRSGRHGPTGMPWPSRDEPSAPTGNHRRQNSPTNQNCQHADGTKPVSRSSVQ